MSVKKQSAIVMGALIALGFLAVSCNLFSFNGPSGDAQLLSAARACFDNGDLQCAAQDYQQLSSADADVATSEQAFLVLDAQGASMGNLMQFVGDIANLGAGQALTNFGQRMNSGAGEAKRLAIWNAFYTYTQITDNQDLQQFVRFIGSLSLAGELLAETQGTDSVLHQADIVTNPATCLSQGAAGCATGTACAAGTSLLTTAAGAEIDYNATTATAGTAPSLAAANADYLYQSLAIASSALGYLGASGKFGSALGLFSTITGNSNAEPSSAAAVGQCFRYSLISLSIGS